MSEVRNVDRPTRAKYDALAEATVDWNAKRLEEDSPARNWIGKKGPAAKNMFAPPEALNQVDERGKSPIESALDNLQYATHLLEGCIVELSRRLEPVSLPCTPIVGNERKPASSPMEEVILDRRDEVIAAHDRIRGIIERLQL